MVDSFSAGRRAVQKACALNDVNAVASAETVYGAFCFSDFLIVKSVEHPQLSVFVPGDAAGMDAQVPDRRAVPEFIKKPALTPTILIGKALSCPPEWKN